MNHSGKEIPDVEDPDHLCGIGSFKPKWLQKLRSPKLYLFIFTLLGTVQGGQYTYFVGVISTLEKKFSFDSKSTAMVMMIGSLSPIVTSVLAGYFANNVHRPRFMAGCMILVAISSVLNALPYFMYGAGTEASLSLNDTKHQMCGVERSNSSCEAQTSLDSTIPALTVLTICHFLSSIGATAFNTVGLPYMDDSVKKKNSVMYIAFSICFRLLGTTFGFLVSSFSLSFPEDPYNDSGYSPKDPRFIGAWWLGFIFLGVLIFVLSLPIALFPRNLRSASKDIAKNKEKKKYQLRKKDLKDLPKDFLKMLKNPIFFWFNLSMILKSNGFIGYMIFMPKYMENQYQQTASEANLLSGIATTLPLIIGTLIGGLLTTKFKPSPRIITTGMFAVEILGCMPSIIAPIFLGCPNINFPGTTSFENGLLNLNNNCNKDCLCGLDSYEPICGPDGVSTHFNPCYAGCQSFNETDAKTIFTDCHCSGNDSWAPIEMTGGYCESQCNYFTPYVIAVGLAETFASLTFTSEILLTLRCVRRDDKSFSIGLSDALVSLLTLLPSPLIYGALTDAACIVWEEKCGEKGNCWLYDNDKFNKYMHIPSIVFFLIGTMLQFNLIIHANRLKNLFNDDDDDKDAEEMKAANGVDGSNSDSLRNGFS